MDTFNRGLQGKISSDQDLLKLLEDDWMVVDVGAGYGANILEYLSCVEAKRIYAFEPLPHNIRLIEENVNEGINFFPFACGDADQQVEMYVPCGEVVEGRVDRLGTRADYIGIGHVRERNLKSLIAVLVGRLRRRKKDYWVSVRQVRLDSMIPKGVIGMLKIDVQGHEESVLKGLGNRIKDVVFAFVEYCPRRAGLIRYLQESEFSIYDGKYIVFGPPNEEETLCRLGFSDVEGFENSLGHYRYDCSLGSKLESVDVFSMKLPKGFKVAETDLILVNKRYESMLADRLMSSI